MHNSMLLLEADATTLDTTPSLLQTALTSAISATVIAALVTLAGNWLLALRRSQEEERARKRELFAQAYATYTEYNEYPYVIRRRNHEKAAEERIRISEQIRQTQERLNFFLAWTQAESQEVGKAYDNLIKQVRRKVGLAMKAAWEAPPITEDAEMSIPQSVVDLGGLEAYESEYFQQLESHLK